MYRAHTRTYPALYSYGPEGEPTISTGYNHEIALN